MMYMVSGWVAIELVVGVELVLLDFGLFDFDGKEVCW